MNVRDWLDKAGAIKSCHVDSFEKGPLERGRTLHKEPPTSIRILAITEMINARAFGDDGTTEMRLQSYVTSYTGDRLDTFRSFFPAN